MTMPPRSRFWPAGLPSQVEVPDCGLDENLAASAARAGDRIAIDHYGRRFTYRELLARVDGLATHLRGACALAAGDRVLLDLQNGPSFVIAYHAVLRAGGIVVPVNPMNRSEELRWIAADSGARIALVGQESWDEVAPLHAGGLLPHVRVAEHAADLPLAGDLALPALLHAPAPPSLPPGVRPLHAADTAADGPPLAPAGRRGEDIAVIAYTSGTTGRPKGCMLSHRALQAAAAALAAWNGWRDDAVALATAPFFHVTGMVGSMNLPLQVGATIVPLARWDPATAADAIESRRVTHWTNVPTMVADLLARPGIERRDLSSLRYIGGGGSAMPEAVAARLQALFGLEYQEGWGLTEVAGAIHLNPVGHARRQCLGLPVFGVDTRVIDAEHGTELAPGTAGELVSRAPSMFSGYWGQPEATAAAFIELDGQPFLRTGDIGRVDEDGYFHLVDRLKRMINAAGYKVWPAEVETLLYRHPAVREACVVAAHDAHRGETVKAYVAWKEGVEPPDLRAFGDWARTQMAAYKIPRLVEVVDALPRSGTGKILWRTLQEREAAAARQPPAD